mmetsp:Transcript_12158/g.13940  ORF Transcript_12158/g.13940 Transcript_12158/m.13940 type:complete len:515 (+) Transcript_12158:82-1626(+)|eukprot:CAMPEP_0194148816 /NCGR_PEP_ID=MMETSP0152-20130528/34620_1 /TAXON_ID=1049557 /ORGANISM="Thalassiothrix antarctica, Strain L6-D1" /LENGTH=514 /DNA_ID=CAMNT_0038850595 /DNA_START=98 /DNA_END=1642 /DNA_ORIENTATION=-
MTMMKKGFALLLLCTPLYDAKLMDLLTSNQKKEVPKKEKKKIEAISGNALDFSRTSSGKPLTNDPVEYGVDVSFPIQHKIASMNYDSLPHNVDPEHNAVPRKLQDFVVQPLGNKNEFYDDFVQSCVDAFGKKGARCRSSEDGRVAMSLRQPQSMTNYTDIGFKKVRAPEEAFKLISEFWEANKEKGILESWGVANTYTNNWQSPTYMVSVENGGLRGGGNRLKQKIWDAARDTIQEWTNQELTQCSLYGIRVYTEDSILSTHVDRLPLVSSAIINVAQDVDEPWPIEVYGHDGKATNVTMEPGDMIMYESHSVLHGRPFPLKGRYYANIFIHFEPVGHTLRHKQNVAEDHGKDVHKKYKEAVSRGVGGHEVDQTHEDTGLPPYIIPGSPEEANWLARHPNAKRSKQRSFSTGSTGAHHAAQAGDLNGVKQAIKDDKDALKKADSNGWTALHESARAGHKDIVKYLHESGADVNARTNHGIGGTALYWAKRNLGEDHEVVSYLLSIGATDIGPDL